jgi:hypothetical protein
MGEALRNRVGLSVDLKLEPDFRPNRGPEGLHGVGGLATKVMALEETRADREEERALTFLIVSGDDRDALPEAVDHRG